MQENKPEAGGNRNRIFALIFLLILVLGVVVGVILVRRQQDIRERASSGSVCNRSDDCILLDEGDAPDMGSHTVNRDIIFVDITAQESHRFFPGNTNDGCYDVTIIGATVTWERIAPGPDCKEISNVQIWMGGSTPTGTATATSTATDTPTSPPTEPPIIAQCLDVKIFKIIDTEWIRVPANEFVNLERGATIFFTVAGSTNPPGNITKARFTINDVLGPPVEDTRPGTQEFYQEYTIPLDINSFSVQAEVFHDSYGWF